MILDNTQAAEYSRILNAKYKKDKDKSEDKDYSHLFQRGDFYTTQNDDREIVKKTGGNLTAQFKKDLVANAHVEEEFCMLYQCHNTHPNAEYKLNEDSRFDMKVTYTDDEGNKYYTYAEIKNDKLAQKHKNIAVEYYSWGKPSSISVTEAFLWVQRIEGFYLVFKTEDLIDYINEKQPYSAKGGDSNASDNYLISVTDALSIAWYVIVDDYSNIYKK